MSGHKHCAESGRSPDRCRGACDSLLPCRCMALGFLLAKIREVYANHQVAVFHQVCELLTDAPNIFQHTANITPRGDMSQLVFGVACHRIPKCSEHQKYNQHCCLRLDVV